MLLEAFPVTRVPTPPTKGIPGEVAMALFLVSRITLPGAQLPSPAGGGAMITEESWGVSPNTLDHVMVWAFVRVPIGGAVVAIVAVCSPK
jgi:hypothetical protein